MFPPFPLHQQVRSRSPSSGSVEAFGSWWRLGRAPQELSGQDTKRRAEAEGPYEDKGLSLGAPCRQFTSDFQFQLCWPGCVVTLCASDCGQGRRKPLSEPLKAVGGRHQALSSTRCLQAPVSSTSCASFSAHRSLAHSTQSLSCMWTCT